MIVNTFLDVDKQEAYAGSEPVSLAETKAHLRVDFDDDDAQIQAMITAARQSIEDYCHISLVRKTIILTISAEESLRSNYAQPFQVRENFNKFELPYGPTVSVDMVTSIDSDGQTVIACALNQDYFLVGAAFKTIKILNAFTNNILVYTAGYAALPGPLRLSILNEVAYRYDSRGDSQGAVRATAFTHQGVCEAARILAEPYKRLTSI